MLEDKRFLAFSDLFEELNEHETEVISGGFPVGTLNVPANQEDGVFFVNTLGRRADFTFTPLGSWAYGHSAGNVVGAEGRGGCSGCTLSNPFGWGGALIMQRLNSQPEFAGKVTTLTLEPNESVKFLMNDTPGTYGNNEGWVGLYITAIYTPSS